MIPAISLTVSTEGCSVSSTTKPVRFLAPKGTRTACPGSIFKLDGMVYILQTVLQIYASMELGKDQKDTSEELVQVLQAQESEWEGLITEFSNAGKISEESFMEELQKKMEKIVLSLSSGSYAQRVQAEYLKELQSRAKSVFDSSA